MQSHGTGLTLGLTSCVLLSPFALCSIYTPDKFAKVTCPSLLHFPGSYKGLIRGIAGTTEKDWDREKKNTKLCKYAKDRIWIP
jgi:hypothetical protein